MIFKILKTSVLALALILSSRVCYSQSTVALALGNGSGTNLLNLNGGSTGGPAIQLQQAGSTKLCLGTINACTGSGSNSEYELTTGGEPLLINALEVNSLNIFPSTANLTPLTISGGSTTGSSTSGVGINISGTLDTTGNVDGAVIGANITNTASGAGTTLMDLQVGGESKFNISTNGNITTSGGIFTSGGSLQSGISSNPLHIASANIYPDSLAMSVGTATDAFSGLWIANSGIDTGVVGIVSDGAGILAQRNGSNAQTLRVYNTYTSSTNYEAAEIDWQGTTNVLSLGTIKGSGGGSARALQLVYGGTNELDFAETNAGEWTFQAPLAEVPIAGAATSQPSGVLAIGNATESGGTGGCPAAAAVCFAGYIGSTKYAIPAYTF